MANATLWQHNALFRVLAFLDNTGTQSFDLTRDVRPDGSFYHPSTLFAPGTAISRILLAGVCALRRNIRELTVDKEALRVALESITGSCEHTRPSGCCGTSSTSPCAERKNPHDDTHKPDEPNEDASSTTMHTRWSRAAVTPHSLSAFAHTLDEPFRAAGLHEALSAAMHMDAHSCTDSSFTEQFLIDALDHWISSSSSSNGPSEAEVNRIVLACGVQPTVLQAVRERPGSASVHALVDFMVDVIFPLPPPRDDEADGRLGHATATLSSSTRRGVDLVDWLIACYRKNHEAVSVDGAVAASEVESGDDCVSSSDELEECVAPTTETVRREREPMDEAEVHAGPKKPRCEGAAAGAELCAVQDEAPCETAEELLTEDTVRHYMMHEPKRVPPAVMRAHRRAWTDSAVTRFELNEHYTAAELRAVVRMLAEMRAGGGATQDNMRETVELDLGHAIDAAVCAAASKAKRKDQFIDVILSLHKPH